MVELSWGEAPRRNTFQDTLVHLGQRCPGRNGPTLHGGVCFHGEPNYVSWWNIRKIAWNPRNPPIKMVTFISHLYSKLRIISLWFFFEDWMEGGVRWNKDPFVHSTKGNTPIESYSRDGIGSLIRIGTVLDSIFLQISQTYNSKNSCWIYPPWNGQFAHENRPNSPQKEISSSNHWFSGANFLLVLGW